MTELIITAALSLVFFGSGLLWREKARSLPPVQASEVAYRSPPGYEVLRVRWDGQLQYSARCRCGTRLGRWFKTREQVGDHAVFGELWTEADGCPRCQSPRSGVWRLKAGKPVIVEGEVP